MPLFPARAALALLVAFAAPLACGDKPSTSPGGARASASAPSASASASARAPAGPCAGVAEGGSACDGGARVTCRGGKPTEPKACLSIEHCESAAGVARCAPACPAGEVYVPATDDKGFTLGTGSVLYGFGKFTQSRKGLREGDAKHNVTLSYPFCLDATEVTVAAWDKCVKESGCPLPGTRTQWGTYPKKPDHPVNMVQHDWAAKYCRDRGQELPTEAQWVWAASGGEARLYPWGNEHPTCDHADFAQGALTSPACDCGCRGGGPSAVGSMTKGDRIWPSGAIHELGGNVWEWMLDAYLPFTPEKQADPLATRANAMYVIKGGGWNRAYLALQISFRGGEPIDYKVPGLGFRCARNPKENTVLAAKIAELRAAEEQFAKIHRR